MSLTWSRRSSRDVLGSRHTFLAMVRSPTTLTCEDVSSGVRRKSFRCRSSASTPTSPIPPLTVNNPHCLQSYSKLACFDRSHLDRVELWPRKNIPTETKYDPKQILRRIGNKCGPIRAGSAFVSPYFSRFRVNYRSPRTGIA
jgi:hypothetical protein